jgi:predicted  nucleic acid-binding Zn-ribbon protein
VNEKVYKYSLIGAAILVLIAFGLGWIQRGSVSDRETEEFRSEIERLTLESESALRRLVESNSYILELEENERRLEATIDGMAESRRRSQELIEFQQDLVDQLREEISGGAGLSRDIEQGLIEFGKEVRSIRESLEEAFPEKYDNSVDH